MTDPIPDGWSTAKLGDIGTNLIGLTYSPKNVKRSGTLVLRSSNIQDGRLAFDDNVYVDSVIPDRIRVRDGDILICVRNGSRRLIGKSVMLDGRVVGQTFGAFMAVYRSDANPFLRYFFQSSSFKRQIDGHLGATINQITNGSLNGFEVALPAREERATIAATLADVDALISTLDRLISKKQAIKEGMAQQLLTGRARLPGFNGAWHEVRIGDLGKTYGGLSGKSGPDFGRGQGRYITFMNVMANVRLDGAHAAAVRIAPAERQNIVHQGDLLFNGSSETPDELALCAAVDSVPPETYLNSFCFGFRPRSLDILDPIFIAYYFRGVPGRRLLYALAQGATRYNLAKSQFRQLVLSIPDVDEQRAISAALTDDDEELQVLGQRLKKAKEVKQGMVQELLSGRTRLSIRGPSA